MSSSSLSGICFGGGVGRISRHYDGFSRYHREAKGGRAGEAITTMEDSYLQSKQSTALSYYSTSPCKLRHKTQEVFINNKHLC